MTATFIEVRQLRRENATLKCALATTGTEREQQLLQELDRAKSRAVKAEQEAREREESALMRVKELEALVRAPLQEVGGEGCKPMRPSMSVEETPNALQENEHAEMAET